MMDGMASGQILAALPSWELAFVLVLCRAGGAVLLLPGFGEAELPLMLRAGLALALTGLLLPSVQPLVPAAPETIADLVAMLLGELLTGMLLGWMARLTVLALAMAGQAASFALGLSSVLQPDATFGGQGTALSRLFGLAAPALVLASGLYALPLTALAGSYHIFPAGGLPDIGGSTQAVTAAVADSFALALRLAAPFLLAGTLWQVVLGLVGRLIPGVPVFFVAQPGQILGGLLLLGLVAGAVLSGWQGAVHSAFAALPGL